MDRPLTHQALKTPRGAAVAGILFSVLFTISIILIRLSLPEVHLEESRIRLFSRISLALTLVPFSGIAFLWFIGVIRDRIGQLEDKFFSTVFLGSGLLFLAMTFASAAVAGGILSSFAILPDPTTGRSLLTFGRAVTHTILNVYAIRMAGVFMTALATICLKTRVMPRPFAFLSYGLAAVMLLSINLSPWLILVFPAWVFVISVHILFSRKHNHPQVGPETMNEIPDHSM
jgi:hypothetical protein